MTDPTPESVEALAKRAEVMAQRLSDDEFNGTDKAPLGYAAEIMRALSARLAEVEEDRSSLARAVRTVKSDRDEERARADAAEARLREVREEAEAAADELFQASNREFGTEDGYRYNHIGQGVQCVVAMLTKKESPPE